MILVSQYNQLGLSAHFVRWTSCFARRLSPRRYVGRVSSMPVVSRVLGYRLGK